MDKIFELKDMQTTFAATVFVRCEEITRSNVTDISYWTEYFGVMAKENEAKPEIFAMFENCKKMLEIADGIGSSAKVWGLYNVPCITGNELMFIIKFDTTEARDSFAKKLGELEASLKK